MEKMVSIIVPSYNHKKHLSELLKSIELQTYTNRELIIIDDGSTDGSVSYLESVKDKYNFKLISKKNEGLCATINQGLAQAGGEYIVIIASDDFMPSNRLNEQVRELSASFFDAIAGGMTLVSEESKVLRYVLPLKNGEVFFDEMLYKNLIYAPTVMFKAEAFKKFGHYNSQHVIEDYSMWLRILSKGGRLANFNYNWAYYRIGPVIASKKVDWYYKGLEQVFSEYADNPKVMKALQFRKFQYLVKVAILDSGTKLDDILNAEQGRVGFWPHMVIWSVARLPQFIRSLLATRINKIN